MVCFIILHYLIYEETVKCVNNLINTVEGDFKIVVVDNCSPNQSGEQLQKHFKNNEKVHIILNDKNDGFARGNNVGYQYAKKYLKPDFAVIMNNDVEIIQKDIIERITKIYDTEKFYVLGPDIFSTSAQIHQSPKSTTAYDLEKVKAVNQAYKKKMDSKILVPLRCCLKQFRPLRMVYHKKKNHNLKIDFSKQYFNVPLHGSCLIFSPLFVQKRSVAFFEGTFFYYESEILDYECKRDHMKTMYDPSIKVYHHQNLATNAAFHSALKKVRFANQCIYNSTSAFLDLIMQDSKK